jgi:cell division protein FtsW
MFLLFLFVGVRIALRAPDYFGFLLAAGITLLISLQVVLNTAVVMGALPTKGMVLPFLSYGGTALVVNLMAAGILLSISRYCVLRSQPR